MKRELAVSLAVLLAFSPAGYAVNLQGTVWEEAGKECGLDPLLLYAIALRESGQTKNGRTAPSPWALYNPVYGSYFPKSYTDARRALKRYLSASDLTDIGIAQINWKWNGKHHTKNPEDLLNPKINVRIAAKVMCQNIRRTPESAAVAIGSYNTANPWKHNVSTAYAESVMRIWKRLEESDDKRIPE